MDKKKITTCKFKLILLTILTILLFLGIFTACTEKQPTQTTITYPEASMTANEVVNLVLVYGIPEFPIKKVQPVGQWGAVYEGKGVWRIQGVVAKEDFFPGVFNKEPSHSETTYYSTTWSFSNNKIILIKYSRN